MVSNVISIKVLKTAFESPNYPLFFSGKQTDEPAFKMVGELVRVTKDRKHIYRIIESGFPSNYQGDTLKQLYNKIDRQMNNNKDEGDEEEKEDAKTFADAIVERVLDVPGLALVHDTNGIGYVWIMECSRQYSMKITSTKFQHWLRKNGREWFGRMIMQKTVREVVDMLHGVAVMDGQEHEAYTRIARSKDGQVIVYLANQAGECVVIDKDGIQTTTNVTSLFIKPETTLSLPVPMPYQGNPLRELQNLMGWSEETFKRLLAFWIGCLKPEGPYMCLLVEGEQGSGKSMVTELTKRLLDPTKPLRSRLPRNDQDLMICASVTHLLLFDNVSGLRADISDSLCTLATGGGMTTRKLYTDDEQKVFDAARPFMLNGISDIASRPDLLERSISIQLAAIDNNKRLDEQYIWSKVDEILPYALYQLYEMVSAAIRNYADTSPQRIRMADAMRWIAAAEPATEFPQGTFLKALLDSQEEIMAENILGNPLAVALIKVAEDGPFVGTMKQLYENLTNIATDKDRSFPSSAAHLSRHLKRLKPALVRVGTIVKIEEKSRLGRIVSVYTEGQRSADSMTVLDGQIGI